MQLPDPQILSLLLCCCCLCLGCCTSFVISQDDRKTLQDIQLELSSRCDRQAVKTGPQVDGLVDTLSDEEPVSAAEKRIVGGEASSHGEWPWLVSLRSDNQQLAGLFSNLFGDTVHGRHYCAGVLIHPQWVLTARHCFVSKYLDYLSRILKLDLELNSPCAWRAVVGEHEIEQPDNTEVEVPVRSIFLAPNVTDDESSVWQPDVALVRLRRPVPVSRYARPACLAGRGRHEDVGVKPGESCVVAGWGKVDAMAKEHSAKLLHATVRIRHPDVCAQSYSRDEPLMKMFQPGGEICAVGDDYTTDACHFDSGGPLMCRSDGSQNRWSVAGIVSRGKGCGMPGYPGIYSSVGKSLEWIANVLHQNQH